MLYCSWCDRNFIDGETITFRDCSGTHVPYHGECFDAWRSNENVLIRVLGESASPVATFKRRFHDHQFGPVE